MVGAKSSAIMAAGVVTAAVILGMTWQQHPQAAAQPAAPPATQAGRFQMASAAGHVYVLDTATGQVWESFVSSNEGSTDKDFKDPKVKAQR